MSKIFVLCFLIALTLTIASIDAVPLAEKLEIMGMAPRSRRDLICWDNMMNCCYTGCRGDGCVRFMCRLCCPNPHW